MKRWLAIGLRMLADRMDPPEREGLALIHERWPWETADVYPTGTEPPIVPRIKADTPLFATPQLDRDLREGASGRFGRVRGRR